VPSILEWLGAMLVMLRSALPLRPADWIGLHRTMPALRENRKSSGSSSSRGGRLELTSARPSVIIITEGTMKPTTMTGALKQAIEESGLTVLEIERATSVKRASVLRFMRGETSLRLDIADRLAAYFGLAVVKRKGK